MTTSLETMHFYTKVLTGMVLLLNIGLLLSIRMALKHARLSCSSDRSEAGQRRWSSARTQIMVLIISVVAMNAGAVFANHRMVQATRDIAAELPQTSEVEYVLSMARRSE